MFKLPNYTLSGRLKKGTEAVPVATWVHSVNSAVPGLSGDPLVLTSFRKKVSAFFL